MTWREMYGEQNMAAKMLEQQGRVNVAEAESQKFQRLLIAAESKLEEIRQIWQLHMDCETNCDVLLLIGEVLDGTE